ncbi:hypothetical protein FALBO_13468 [Fusarium albosuccineum]|uniref:Uncharacterized protein n=1 Tax=Fusarium albosuccineum TaxID=1237068 RepID=A0A8H4L215_9HYPO|nr:hypothetical protein FALBO_13468 [Fusarium albosuccineum]
MTAPAPPSDDEKRLYYYGFPSQPKLVARSDAESTPWALETDGKPTPKCLDPVNRHPMVELWDDSNGSLRREVIRCSNGVKWNAIEIFRIGDCRLRWSHRRNDVPKPPVKLLISVDSDSLHWPQAWDIAKDCREVLQAHGLEDVHCEIRESRIMQL